MLELVEAPDKAPELGQVLALAEEMPRLPISGFEH